MRRAGDLWVLLSECDLGKTAALGY